MNREQERKNNIEKIDKFVAKGNLTEDEITFFCLKTHGLSPIFVKKYLEKCIDFGFFGKKQNGEIVEKKSVIAKED